VNFKKALSDLDCLKGLVSSETPIYEASLGEILRGRILAQKGEIEESIKLLEKVEIRVMRRHWGYQIANAKIQLSQQKLLMLQLWSHPASVLAISLDPADPLFFLSKREAFAGEDSPDWLLVVRKCWPVEEWWNYEEVLPSAGFL
jgi:hypothetical protein